MDIHGMWKFGPDELTVEETCVRDCEALSFSACEKLQMNDSTRITLL